MNKAIAWNFNAGFPPLVEKHPGSLFFEHMEERLGNACPKVRVKKNTIICHQGARLSALHLIVRGEIMLTRLSADGRETLISILGPGDFFGESSLLSGTPVTFSASTTKPSVLLPIPALEFKKTLEETQACRILLEVIVRRCDDAWSQIEILGCTNVREKVRTGLLWLSERIGVQTQEGVRIDLNQTQLARMVGCARETLSREVSKLKRLRAIDVCSSNGRKSLLVVNAEELS